MKPVLAIALAALTATACDLERLEGTSDVPPIAELAPDLSSVLAEAEAWEILALEPVEPGPEDEGGGSFHGYAVRGSKTLESRSARAQLAHALNAGIAGNQGQVAACFLPRHGIRATAGPRTVDLVICFECLQIHVHDGGDSKVASLLTTSGPRRVFDEVYTGAGLSIAD